MNIPQRRVLGTSTPGCIAASLLLVLVSCSSSKTQETIREGAKNTVLGISEGLSEIESPALEKLEEGLLSSDSIKLAAAQFAEGTAMGLRAAMEDWSASESVESSLVPAIESLEKHGGDAIARLLERLGGQLSEMLDHGVRSFILASGSALRESAERDLADALALLAKEASKGAALGLAEGLSESGLLDGPDVEAASEFARTVASESVNGALDAFNNAFPEFKEQLGKVDEEVGRAAEGIQTGFIVGAVLLAALFVLAVIFLVHYIRQSRKSTKTLAIVAQKINESRSEDLKEHIHTSAVRNGVQDWLSDFLKQRGL